MFETFKNISFLLRQKQENTFASYTVSFNFMKITNNMIISLNENKNTIIHSVQYTFLRVSFLWCPEKAADPVRTDDEGLQRGVERLDLLSYGESRCLTVCSLFGSLALFSAAALQAPTHNLLWT